MRATNQKIIQIHIDAPSKPAYGETCNGCGICCASEPCPMSMLWLQQFRGPCRALIWQNQQYRCGLLTQPQQFLHYIPHYWHATLTRWISKRIACGSGCDCTLTIN